MSSLGGLDVLERALVVVVGRADERVPEPRQREDRAPGAGGHDRAADSGRSSWRSVTCVPRLGRMRGSSASSCSSRGRSSSAHTPVALTTLAACTSNSSPLSPSRARTPCGAPVALEQAGHVDAVGAHRAEALGLAEHRQHEAHVVGLAVVEQVAARRLARGERRQQLERPPRRRSRDGAPGSRTRRRRTRSARAPARRPTRARRPSRGALCARAAARRPSAGRSPTSRRRGSARRRPGGRGARPSKAATTSGSGRTRCGASATISWRSSSASRTSPRSKFCR